MKGGTKAGSRTVVVHVSHNPAVDASGPRCGLIVSKAVGNAVIRHRTSRRLRHVFMSLTPGYPPTLDVVIRALGPAGSASSEELRRDVEKALSKAVKKS